MNVVRVECEVYDVVQFNDRTGRNLRDHLRRIVYNGILSAFVIQIAVDLRFRAQFFDNVDFSFYDRIGRVGNEQIVFVNIFGANAERYGFFRIQIFVEILDFRNDRLGKHDFVSADKVDVNFAAFLR